MPTYEYKCEACGDELEVFHGMSESAPACPNCGEHGLKKAFRTPPRMMDTSEMKKNWPTSEKKKDNADWIGQRQKDAQDYKRTGH